MHGIGARFAGDADDVVDGQIGLHRPQPLADEPGFIGLEAVQGELVLARIDGDAGDAQLAGGADDADGDLAAVGDEQLADAALRTHGNPPRGWMERGLGDQRKHAPLSLP